MYYIVKNQDVDGEYFKKFKRFSNAAKYFEDMSGYSIEKALNFYYYEGEVPSFEKVGYAKMVSDYGNVVSIEVVN